MSELSTYLRPDESIFQEYIRNLESELNDEEFEKEIINSSYA